MFRSSFVFGRRVMVSAVAVVVLPLLSAPGVVFSSASGSSPAPDAPTWAVPQPPATLVLTTEGAAPIVSKDDYLQGSLQLAGVTYPMEIKGRGNSTWKWPKKPFKIKFEDPVSLMGMPAQDDWVLLASYADRSALRNHLALSLARQTRLAWTPRSTFVDVMLNGKSQGLYLLADQVEQGPDRANLPDGSYLLEVDERFRASDDPGFRSRRRTPISYKDPDELTFRERKKIKKAVNDFERVLYGADFADPVAGYPAMVDVDSFVDWYIVEEFFRNQDSNFYSSVYVSWTPGGLFGLGPVWDFDLSAGTKWNIETTPQGWHTRRGDHWVARMLEDPTFSAKVKDRLLELKPTLQALVDQVPAAAAAIRPAALVDWSSWHQSGAAVVGSVHADNFDGEVDFLHSWLRDRVTWITEPEVIFGMPDTEVLERDQVIEVPVRILAGDKPVSVDYAYAGGKATRGEDFEVSEGTLHFDAGETVKTFPLTVRADALAEGPERIHLALRNSHGAMLGHPQRLTVTLGASDLGADAQLRSGQRGRFKGVGVINTTGRGQTVHSTARIGSRQTFEMRVSNDAAVPGFYRVKGNGGGRGVKVRYYVGRADVTRQVRSSKGWRVRIGGSAAKKVRAVVRIGPKASVGSTPTLRMKTVWKGDVRSIDAVRAAFGIRR